MKFKSKLYYLPMVMLGIAGLFASCSSDKTYAELLADEKDAISYYVSENGIKAVYVSDEDLEDYVDQAKWDEEANLHFQADTWYRFSSNVYMNIHSFGDTARLFKERDDIIIRCEAYRNLLNYAKGDTTTGSNMTNPYQYWAVESYSPSYASSLGAGMELPLKFVGDKARVSLIVPSKMGNSDDISSVIPRQFTNLTYKLSNQ